MWKKDLAFDDLQQAPAHEVIKEPYGHPGHDDRSIAEHEDEHDFAKNMTPKRAPRRSPRNK